MNLKKYTTFSGKMIAIIQLFALVASIIGAFLVTWSWVYAFTAIFFFYLYNVIGMSMMLHRFWSHRSFKFKNIYVEKFFTLISIISSRGSPLAWAHIHREHHKFADETGDPHKPCKFSVFSFRSTYITDVKPFLIRDFMTKEHKLYHEYYLLFILCWIIILTAISPQILYFVWILPVCFNQVVQDSWNYFSHTDGGYRNFETKDNSRNISWLFPLILGEAWHNNHHNNQQCYSTQIKKWEHDPVSYIIRKIGN